MGQRIVNLAPSYGFAVAGALLEPGAIQTGQALALFFDALDDDKLRFDDQAAQAMRNAELVIDFALARGLEQRLQAAVNAKIPFVCGSTGLDQTQQDALAKAGQKIPVLWAPNMSTGVNVLLQLVEQAARMLPEFEAEIHEIHHHHKTDAPSGTAVALAKKIARARQLDDDKLLFNRGPGLRRQDEIGVVANRGGEVVGEHTVYLFGEGERLELIHRAGDRDIFVRGALRAGQWILNQKPGLYRMADSLLQS
jgi:4-hydroxy-tetrahydrodipicolinate reductase